MTDHTNPVLSPEVAGTKVIDVRVWGIQEPKKPCYEILGTLALKVD